jgi:hypothetical protein
MPNARPCGSRSSPTAAKRCAPRVGPLQAARGQAPAQGLTAIRMAAAQLAVLSGEASPTKARYVGTAHPHRAGNFYIALNHPQFFPGNHNS